MGFDWSGLRDPAPGELVAAREAAHWAVQWVAKAARANLPAAPDDGHTALAWDAALGGFACALPEGITVSLSLSPLELVLTGDGETRRLALEARRRPSAVDQWFDEALSARGLQHASQVALPYEAPERPAADPPGLEALASWYGAAAEVLEELRSKYSALRPGPVRLWPHHFDLAVLVGLDEDGGESSRSIGVGVSPGDAAYAQPYAYVSPYPAPKDPQLPALPPGGRWHTQDFFAAVATADDLLAQEHPRAALLEVIDTAFEASRHWLDQK